MQSKTEKGDKIDASKEETNLSHNNSGALTNDRASYVLNYSDL